MGTSCYPAWLLQELGLRNAAYPFDWIFSTPAMVTHMLEDRFGCFLDPRFVRPTIGTHQSGEGDSQVCGHAFYHDHFGVEWVFNHHDLSRPEVAATYARRTDRFVAALRDGRKTLLLMINTGGDTTQEGFERLCRAIDAYGPANTLLQIDVVRTGDVLDFGMGQPLACDRHRRRVFRSTYSINGVRFPNPIDDYVMRACVGQYRFAAGIGVADIGHPSRG